MRTHRILSLTLVLSTLTLAGCGAPSERGESGATSRPRAAAQPHPSLKIPAGSDFGAGITRNQVDDYTQILSSPESYLDRPVLVRAEVMDVCKTKGCWIKVTDGTTQARVKFHDYAFFLPKDCEGQVAWIEGRVTKRTIPVDELKHYAAESGTEDPDKIMKPLTQVGFMATGVRLTAAQ